MLAVVRIVLSLSLFFSGGFIGLIKLYQYVTINSCRSRLQRRLNQVSKKGDARTYPYTAAGQHPSSNKAAGYERAERLAHSVSLPTTRITEPAAEPLAQLLAHVHFHGSLITKRVLGAW